MQVTLDQVIPGKSCRIEATTGTPELVQRLLEFGLMEGETIEVIGCAPLGDPMEIEIGGSRLSLRKSEAATISVTLLP